VLAIRLISVPVLYVSHPSVTQIQHVQSMPSLHFLSYVKKHLTPCIIEEDIDFR